MYRADVTNNKTDEHKYHYGMSDTPSKEHENHKTSFRHISHLTTSDLFKYYWKLVDNGAVPTIKFSIATHVKGNTFVINCNLCLSENAFIIRNLDDIYLMNICVFLITSHNILVSVMERLRIPISKMKGVLITPYRSVFKFL